MRRGKLGPNQQRVMNVMIDAHHMHELGEMTGLERGAVKDALDSLADRALVVKVGTSGRWALTHAGKRMVR